MNIEQFNNILNITPEKLKWLGVVKDISLKHLHYMETTSESGLYDDDYGLAEIEKAFLYVYGLAHALGAFDNERDLK